MRAEAAKHGRQVRFSVSFRPILAATEDEAWARAHRILDETRRLREAAGLGAGGPQQSEGARRLLAAAERGSRVDKRRTEIAKLTGARSNSTALVGTPEQVADALLDYYDLGVTTFLIRGFDPLEDAIDYGRELIPRVRSAVAARDAPRGLAQRSLLEPSAIMSAVLASPIRTTSGLELAEAPRQHFWFDPPAPRIDVAAERRHRQERLAGAFRLFARFGFSQPPATSPHATPSCPTTSG